MRPSISLPFSVLFLPLAACHVESPGTDDPAPVQGEWQVRRVMAGAPDEGCPAITFDRVVRIDVGPAPTFAVTGDNVEGELEADGSLRFSTYEWVQGDGDEFDTLGGHSLRYDEEADELFGTGSIGCGEGCDYDLTLDAVRIEG